MTDPAPDRAEVPPLSRQTFTTRPQVQQATVFLTIVTPRNAKPALPEKALLAGGLGGGGRLGAWRPSSGARRSGD